MPKINITAGIFLLLTLGLAFLILNDPNNQIKEISNFNIVLLVAGAFAVFSGSYFFIIKNAKDFFGDAANGTVFGITIALVVSWIIGIVVGVYNLLANFPVSAVTGFNPLQVFFVAEIWPLTETILLVGGVLVLIKFLPKWRIANFNASVLLAIAVIMLFFAAYHFNTYGRVSFEYNWANLPQFALNTQNLGKPFCNPASGLTTDCYAGALPQFLLGGTWIVLALGFKSWVVAWRAHAISNKVALLGILGLNPIVLLLFAIDGIIIFLAWKKGLLFTELKSFSWKGVWT